MKRRLISTLLCAAVLAAYAVMPVSANSLSYSDVTFDESAWSTTSFDSTVSFTDDDGTTITITQPTPGSVTDAGFVADNPAGNKYLQFENTTSTNAQPTLYIKPAAPLTEDFAIEFDYAADGLSYGRAFRAVAYPVHADGVQTSATGNKFLEINTANSTTTNCKIPINGTDTTKGTYTRDKKFQSVKIVTKFAGTGNPTFDVYIGGTVAATGIPYTSYNGKGIAELRFEMNVSTTYVQRLAFDNIKIYDVAVPKYNGTFDFEANQYAAINRQKDSGATTGTTLTFDDGTFIHTQVTSTTGSSAITMTDSGFVTNNPTGNTYMQVEFKGNENNMNPGEIAFVPNTAFTEDFVMDFKFAIDTNYPYGGYVADGKTAYWPVNAPTMTLKVYPTGRSTQSENGSYGQSNYSSRTMSFGGANSYYYIQPNANGSSAYGQPTDPQIKYVSGKQFEDIRVIFKNVTSAPTYSAYRKKAGSDYYELIAADIPLSTRNYNSSSTNNPDYTSGLKTIKFEFFDYEQYLTDDFYVKIAIDDIKFTKLNQDKVDFSQVSAKLEGGKYYPEVTATSYFEEDDKEVQVITAVYDANGMMTGKEIKPLTLEKGVPAKVKSEGVTAVAGGYVRVYVVDSLKTLNNVVDYYTTE